MSEISKVQVQELLEKSVLLIEDGNHGEYRPRRDEFTPDGIAYIRAADMGKGEVDFDGAEKINSAAYNRIRKGVGRPFDVILSHKGTVGKVSLAPSDSPAYVCSPQTTFWRSLEHGVLVPRYLLYFMRSPDFVQQIISRQSESDMAPYVSLTEQRKLWIRLPSPRFQQQVSELLAALDDKIAVNMRIAKATDELRAMMFVRSSNSTKSEKIVRPLSSLAKFVNGRAFTREATGVGRMVVRIAELNSGPGSSTVYNDVKVAEEHLARPGDVLFAWSGSLTVARWYRHEAIVNQHIFKVIPRDGIPQWMIFDLVQSQMPTFRAIAADKATTMGHIQRRHLDTDVVVPTRGQWDRLDEELGPLWSRALAAEQESLVLAQLRDVLLPKLMSGELRVRDAEKMVEEVV